VSGLVQGPPHVVCDVCGIREVAALKLGPGYVACEVRDAQPHDPGERQVWQYRWAPEPAHDATIRVWCDDQDHRDWLKFQKVDAVAAAKTRGVVRAVPLQRG
jgi:hypothetical protein